MRIPSIWVLLGLLAAPAMVCAQTLNGAGGALAFTAPGTYVQIASNASFSFGNTVTFEAWVNPSVAGTYNTIISRGDGGNGFTDYILQLQPSGSRFMLAFFGAGNWEYSIGTIPNNTWTHVAFTYDGTTKQFFTNGVSAGTAPRSGSLYFSGSPVYIGRQGSVCNCNLFNGQMDEVRVWNTVRTSTQISQNFNKLLTGTEAGLAAYYKFDYITGVTTRDSSTNGNTGTLVNRPLPVFSGVPMVPLTLGMSGPNPLTNDCHIPFVEPGVFLLAPPYQLGANFNGSFAVKPDGTLKVWGGDNTFVKMSAPVSATNLIAAAMESQDMVALRADGSVLAWGRGLFGQTNIPVSATNIVALAAGNSFNLAVRSDGSVVGWGDSNFGQTNVPASATGVVAVATGSTHCLALRSDGSVVAWGMNNSGQTNVPATATNAIAIAAGGNGSLALRADGSVVAWGVNSSGQTNVPASATNVIAIARGSAHNVALRADGSVIAWGSNSSGQTNVPAGATNIVAIAVGNTHNLALRADGSLVGWGANNFGQLSVPTDINSQNFPLSVSGSVNVNAPGSYLLTYTATNATGGSATTNRAVTVADLTPPQVTILGANPVILTVGQPFVDPGATAYDLCNGSGSVTASGTVNTNVRGLYQRIYTAVDPAGNSRTAQRSVLVLAQPFVGFVGANPFTNECHTAFIDPGVALQIPPRGIAAGGHDSFAIRSNGTVTAWGDNSYGQTNVPSGATNVIAVAVGFDQDLALRADGSLIGWGNNSYGQTNIPANATNVVAVASGGRDYNLILRADGTPVAWGYNADGETNVPASATNIVAIASGYYHGLALRANGTLVAWGFNNVGQTDIPPTATNVIAISAADLYNLALRADGSVLAWGDNGSGQTNVPASATNVVAIAAGGATGFALRGDGVLIAWGFNGTQETNIPGPLTNIVVIAAGDQHALAMRADGTVIAWGANGLGQTNVPSDLYASIIPFGASGTVNANVPGTYFVTYTATNNSLTMTNTRTVVVADTTVPVLNLLGANPLQLALGTPFVDPGATAMDSCAGDLTGSINISGSVNISVPGSYTLTYNVIDPSGNSAAATNRTVRVVTAPSLGGFAATPTANPDTAAITAQLSANINPNGLDSTAYFQYGLTTAYTISNAPLALQAGYASSNFTTLAPNLSRSVVYHWRAVGSNAAGVTFGPDQILLVPGLTIPGDLNGDGILSQSELNAMLSNYFSTSPWLYLTNVAGLGQSNITFQLTNSLQGSFTVQVSTNLTDWQPLGSAVPFYKFQDTNAPGASTRYYRLQWP